MGASRRTHAGSGRCEGERDYPITLSFVCFYALLPPVTGMLGLPLLARVP